MAVATAMTRFKSLYERYWADRQSLESKDRFSPCSPNEIVESVEALLSGGGKLLDVGCGNGMLMDVAKLRYEHRCTGVIWQNERSVRRSGKASGASVQTLIPGSSPTRTIPLIA